MVTVKAKTEDVIVILLDEVQKPILRVRLDQGVAAPKIARIYRDRVEIDAEIESSYTAGQRRIKTFKFWFHDLLLMNETLFRITHPT